MSRAWSSGSGRPWRRVRAFVLARDGYVCQFPSDLDPDARCGAPADQVDHIVPRFQHGTDHPENLRAACRAHNAARGAAGLPVPIEGVRRSWTW